MLLSNIDKKKTKIIHCTRLIISIVGKKIHLFCLRYFTLSNSSSASFTSLISFVCHLLVYLILQVFVISTIGWFESLKMYDFVDDLFL